MSYVDIDFEAGIRRLLDAISDLKKQSTAISREKVCIESRAVYGIFLDESYWHDEVDIYVKANLNELFQEATRLMATEKDALYDAVNKRRMKIEKTDIVTVRRAIS